jgi:hypothetical protein
VTAPRVTRGGPKRAPAKPRPVPRRFPTWPPLLNDLVIITSRITELLIWENIQFTKFGYSSWKECGTVPSRGLHCCAGCRPLPRSPILGARAPPGGRRRGAPPLVERTACHPSNALQLSSKCSDLLEYTRSIGARRPIPCSYPPLLELYMPLLTSIFSLNIGRPARVDTRRLHVWTRDSDRLPMCWRPQPGGVSTEPWNRRPCSFTQQGRQRC